MEAGEDTPAPAPGAAEDLADTQLPGEESGVHGDPPDLGDPDLEETGVPSPHWGPGRNFLGVVIIMRGGQRINGESFGTEGSSPNHSWVSRRS
jgi:hypothetical protein